MFSPFQNPGQVSQGLPVTANPDVVGPTGGFGWLLILNEGAPRTLTLSELEIDPASPLLLSIPYPAGTQFTITAQAPSWCWEDATYNCAQEFSATSSVDSVRFGPGNTYFVDTDGVLTLRVVEFPASFVGNPNWFIPDYNSPGRNGYGKAIPSFSRDGVLLPQIPYGVSLEIRARCPSDNNFSPTDGNCPESVFSSYDPDVCDEGYVQRAYDRCCQIGNDQNCIYADGSRSFWW